MPEIVEHTLSGLFLSQFSWMATAKIVLAAFVFGQVLAWVYERTFQGLSYSKRFVDTLVLTTVATAVLVLAIGRSLYAGLGLLGVLSMIRFRTNLKTPRDLVFLLSAVVFGVASGVDSTGVAAVGVAGFGLVALYLHHGPLGTRVRFDGVLRFRVTHGENIEELLKAIFARYCSRTAVLSIGEVAQGSMVEHTYQVKLMSRGDRSDLLSNVRQLPSVRDARLLMQDMTLEY